MKIQLNIKIKSFTKNPEGICCFEAGRCLYQAKFNTIMITIEYKTTALYL